MIVTQIYTWEPKDVKRGVKFTYNHSNRSAPAQIVQIADTDAIKDGKAFLVVDASGYASGPGTPAEVAALLTTNNSAPLPVLAAAVAS